MKFIKNEEITKIREGKQKDATKEARILVEKHERDIALAFEKQAREAALKEGFIFTLRLLLPNSVKAPTLKIMAQFLIDDITTAGYFVSPAEVIAAPENKTIPSTVPHKVWWHYLLRPGDDALVEADFYIDVQFRGKDFK